MLKKISILLCAFFCSFQLFAQELLELEQEESVKTEINPALQRDFVIVEGAVNHDLNPQTTSMSSDAQLLTGLYEGLFSYHPVTLDPQYALAVDYKISRDKKRWTFKLRTDARFSNGEFITAQNVKDSWLQLLATPKAPYASLLDVIRGAADYRNGTGSADNVGITVVSNQELCITLVKPANYLPKLLCHSAFSVIHRNPTVYSGPFYVDDAEPGIIVLKRNPYYWDVQNTNLEKITFVQSDDDIENTYAYNTGIADWLTDSFDLPSLIDKQSMQMQAEFGTSYMFFKHSPKNSRRFSVWDYKEFRQALFEAIPWESLRANYYVPATTLVYPLHGYPEVEGFSYTDKNEALYLMKEAKRKYNIPEDTMVPLVLETTEKAMEEEKQRILKEVFAEIGVELTIRALPSYIYFNNVSVSDADLLYYSWIGDFADPLAFLELFYSSSSLNDSGWSNSEYDALLDKAAVCGEEERFKLLGQAEEILLSDFEVIPVTHPVTFNIIDLNEVGGWSTNAFNIHPLKYLYKKAEVIKLPNMVRK